MKNRYKLCFALIVPLAMIGCKKSENPMPGGVTPTQPSIVFKAPSNFRVVGYMLSEDIVSGLAARFNMARINYLNITFSDTSGEGKILNTPNLDDIIAAAHKNNVKVLAFVGNDFVTPHFYATESARTSFINNLMGSITSHQFDGVDVDLEGNYINKNYEAFVAGLSAALKLKGKLLTAAIATWESDSFTDKSLTYFDDVNIMSYDDTGPWDPSDPGPHSPYSMAVNDLAYWTNTRGIPKEKANVGVPFYGYGFGATAVSTFTYAQIVSKFPNSENTDQLTEPNGAILYYNGIPTIEKKTTMAMQNAGGVMIWELLYDTTGDKSLLTAIDKTANPDND
jgi:spore germination protein YaaH